MVVAGEEAGQESPVHGARRDGPKEVELRGIGAGNLAYWIEANGQLTVWAQDGGDLAVARVEDASGNLLGTYTASGIAAA